MQYAHICVGLANELYDPVLAFVAGVTHTPTRMKCNALDESRRLARATRTTHLLYDGETLPRHAS